MAAGRPTALWAAAAVPFFYEGAGPSGATVPPPAGLSFNEESLDRRGRPLPSQRGSPLLARQAWAPVTVWAGCRPAARVVAGKGHQPLVLHRPVAFSSCGPRAVFSRACGWRGRTARRQQSHPNRQLLRCLPRRLGTPPGSTRRRMPCLSWWSRYLGAPDLLSRWRRSASSWFNTMGFQRSSSPSPVATRRALALGRESSGPTAAVVAVALTVTASASRWARAPALLFVL